VRIPLVNSRLPLPADGHEYLNVAWNLAHGYGFRKTIKWNYYVTEPVIHSALADRSIFYPLFLAPFVKVLPVIWLAAGLRLISVVLCALTVALAYLLWRRRFGAATALAAGIILAVQPGYLEIGSEPLSEALFLFLIVGSFFLAERATSPKAWGIVGVLTGLAYLTRPNGIFVVFCLLLYIFRSDRSDDRDAPLSLGRRRRDGFALIAGFLAASLPFWIGNAIANGSPFASDLRLAYSVANVADATWDGFGKTFPTPFAYVLGHPRIVFQEMANQTWSMVATFAASLPFLITFALFMRKKQLQGFDGAMVAFGFVNLIFYCVSWTVSGAVRYLLPTMLCFVAPLFQTADDLNLPPLKAFGRDWRPIALLVFVMLAWYQPWTERIYFDSQFFSARPAAMYQTGADWLKSRHPGPNAVVASNNPWMVDYLTHLPSVVCPSFGPAADPVAFVQQYHVRYIVLFGRANVGTRDAELRRSPLSKGFHLLPHSVRIWDVSAAAETVHPPKRSTEP
jgi:4-amino-4-deoxy-L-arabinose transferase-like glycosyltransferase